MGSDYALVSVVRSAAGLTIEHAVCLGANKGTRETMAPPVAIATTDAVTLKVTVDAGANCQFAYSTDGRTFATVGTPFTARPGQWIGARVGVFASAPPGSRSGGYVEVEWFRIQ
jgi:hypothetical protein